MAFIFSLFTKDTSSTTTVTATPAPRPGSQYAMSIEIAERNLSFICNYIAGQKFNVNKSNGEITPDKSYHIPGARYLSGAFQTDAIYATYVKAQEYLSLPIKETEAKRYEEMLANYEGCRKAGGGHDRLRQFYNGWFSSIPGELDKIKSELLTPEPEKK